MNIKKVFNNNVALTEDANQTEMVVMGKGLAFQKKIGDTIDMEKIEKTFVVPSQGFTDKFSALLDEIPHEILVLSRDIVDVATKKLQTDLNDSLYLSLADHIDFAISRTKHGLPIKNPLAWEVQKFYKKEYDIARNVLGLIEERVGIRLPEDEAASIALHLFNAKQEDAEMEETMAMTEIVTDITDIVKYHFGIEFDMDSMNYSRFITHLRYFAYRMLRKELHEDDRESSLFEQVKGEYPEAYACTQKVQAYLNRQYGVEMTKDEATYFMIHIHRVSQREKNN